MQPGVDQIVIVVCVTFLIVGSTPFSSCSRPTMFVS